MNKAGKEYVYELRMSAHGDTPAETWPLRGYFTSQKKAQKRAEDVCKKDNYRHSAYIRKIVKPVIVVE